MVRDPLWQQGFLAQPLTQRKAQIAELRSRSEQAKSYKDSTIMDVNAHAIVELLRRHDFPPLLIHGHTHRPGAMSSKWMAKLASALSWLIGGIGEAALNAAQMVARCGNSICSKH